MREMENWLEYTNKVCKVGIKTYPIAKDNSIYPWGSIKNEVWLGKGKDMLP